MEEDTTVPIDLYRAIVDQINDLHTLTLLSLTNKVFHFEATRILYKCSPKLSPIQHLKFLRTIAQNAYLASLVKTYSLVPMAGTQRGASWQLLEFVLPMMINLKHLSLLAFSSDLRTVIFGRLVCQLETLEWNQVDMPRDEPQFSEWISKQKALKHLRLIYRRPIEITPESLSNLVSLEGNLHVIEAILPGRPNVQRIHWIADATYKGHHASSCSNGLFAELQHIKSLSFETRLNWIEYNTIAYNFLSLTFLEIIGHTDTIQLQQDVGQLININIPPNLRILVFSFDKSNDGIVFPSHGRSDIVGKLFGNAHNLWRIDIAERKMGSTVFYERWEKDVGRTQDLVHSNLVRESCTGFHGR